MKISTLETTYLTERISNLLSRLDSDSKPTSQKVLELRSRKLFISKKCKINQDWLKEINRINNTD